MSDPVPGDYNHDDDREALRAYFILKDGMESACEVEGLAASIARDVSIEGMDDGDSTEIERVAGAVVALCNVTAGAALIAARQVVCLERIAAALERAFPPPKPDPNEPSPARSES